MMNSVQNSSPRGQRNAKNIWVFALCVAGVLINLIFTDLAQRLGTLLYLDTVGTVLVSVMGGYLPGILVGFLTNILKSIQDLSSIYYGVLNVLIAVCAAYFAGKGLSKKIYMVPGLILSLTAIGGGLGTLLPWFLDGVVFESESLSAYLYEMGGLSLPAAQLAANLLVDLADKAVTVLLVLLVLRLLPERFHRRRSFTLWRQVPLTGEEEERTAAAKCRTMSMKTKILVALTVVMVAIGVAATSISLMIFRQTIIDNNIKLAEGVATVAAGIVDGDKTDEYIEKGESGQGYLDVERRLYDLRDSSANIEYVYVYKIMEDGCHVVFDLDTETEMGSEPGDVIPFDESFRPYLKDLLAGREIEPVTSDDTYGWLLTVYKPVYDADGVCRCYAAVDISMEEVERAERNFFVQIASLFLGFFILILALGWWYVEYNIVLPVNTMAASAGRFAYNSEDARESSVDQLRGLDICTGDEIENLYQALVKTTGDSVSYVADIQNKNETISKMQNALIMVLADMVESRDENTGDHVRKTAAYTGVIMREMKRRGYYKDELTDEFITDVINSAPLHDVGKIKVSDMILNKPGKLTDEEFEKMKYHTTAGKEVISQAIRLVPDSRFLEEAKNLAACHHEKWNGTGYPEGLKGEEIPLSARIMAVADVFDALVSRRSYKEPFPMDKALDIIREGSGSHFDPKVVDAFFGAEEEIRRVAETFMGE